MSRQKSLSHEAIIPRLLQLQALLGQAGLVQPWERWVDLDITMPQFKLLLLIASRNGARVGDLAVTLGVTPPSVTTILDRLVEHDLVRRENDPVDRRLVIVRTTAAGRQLLLHLNLHADSELAECAAELTEDDLRALLAGLEALHRVWQARQTRRAGDLEAETAC